MLKIGQLYLSSDKKEEDKFDIDINRSKWVKICNEYSGLFACDSGHMNVKKITKIPPDSMIVQKIASLCKLIYQRGDSA